MTKKTLIMLFTLLLTVSLLASCLGTNIRETEDRSDDTSAEATEKTADPTDGTTTASATETTEPTPATENTEPMDATLAVPADVLTETVVFDEYELQIGYWNASYLKKAESAWVFDEDVLDGLLAGAVFSRTELAVGTVVLNLNDIRPEPEVFPGKTLFYLADGRCVFFEQTTTEDRERVYNGKSESDFFGASSWDDYSPVEKKPVKNYELLPNTPLDSSTQPQNIMVKVDWNGDGKVDTIKREIADASAGRPQVIRYTDGKSGKTTDITERIDGQYLSDNVMLLSDGTDNQPALVDCYDVASSDYEVFIYTFDPVKIVSLEVIHNAAFVYEDGELFIDTNSFLFGNLSGHRTPVLYDGKTLVNDPDAREIWWKEALSTKKEGGLSRYFTYTLTEIPVEKKVSGGFEKGVVPSGVAVFPQYYYWDDDNAGITGYVHFLLADGTECRSEFEYDTEYDNYWFGNDPQWELFYTPWAG